MKTNQVMVRPMGCFSVEQRTKDGMFNATALIRQWNESHPEKQRTLDNFWRSTNLVEFMSEMAKCELGIKSVDFTELKNALSKTHKGKQGGTWMLPNLFIKFAMYINPQFEYHVIRFVSDSMIAYRNEAGDAYKELSSAVAKLVTPNFMPVAMRQTAEAINWCVFNQHEPAIRNKHGEESSMRRLFELERKVASLIDEGFICKFEDTMEYLRDQWRKANIPKVFSQEMAINRARS